MLFAQNVQLFHYHLFKRPSFLTELPCTLVKNQLPEDVCPFLTSLFCPTDVCVYPWQFHPRLL